MKIRMKGDSLRLRLSQSEIEEFSENGRVSDSINFGTSKLIYMLQSEQKSTVGASYKTGFITVSVPQTQGKEWADSDQVGIQGDVTLSGGKVLSILIEKDFQCLKPRPGEDESDLFENPQAED